MRAHLKRALDVAGQRGAGGADVVALPLAARAVDLRDPRLDCRAGNRRDGSVSAPRPIQNAPYKADSLLQLAWKMLIKGAEPRAPGGAGQDAKSHLSLVKPPPRLNCATALPALQAKRAAVRRARCIIVGALG